MIKNEMDLDKVEAAAKIDLASGWPLSTRWYPETLVTCYPTIVLELIAMLRDKRAKAPCYPTYYLPPPTHRWWFT